MNKSTFWAGIAAGIFLSLLIGFLILPVLGIFDTTATGKLNILDWWGEVNLENSLRWRATDSKIPADTDTARGFALYREMCLHCHGAPGAEREKWAHHMLPLPPKFWEDGEFKDMSDGEIFSLVRDGIRMTGMPAFGPFHSEKDIWNMVAFIRRLDKLTDREKQLLQETAKEYDHD
jgi:mono/diheme cytochrome c family protein